MLRILDAERPMSRRELLTVGGLGLGSLALPSLLAARNFDSTSESLSGKSVIFLFQQGGPSQFETFDPKPDAPDAIRTIGDVLQTRIPGVHFGETLPQLARRVDQLTLVRSFQTRNGGHNIQPLVGPDSEETNIGSHYSRVAGASRPGTGMPTNAVIFPRAVDPDVPKPQARGNLAATGEYGSAYAPFVPGAGGELQADMQLHLDRDRFVEQRRPLLERLDRLTRNRDASGQVAAQDDLQEQAYRLLLGRGVSDALDLSLEDPRVVEQYDTKRFVRKNAWNNVSRGRRGYYTAQAQTIGKLLLLARRLCEAGCGFITIHAGYAGVWDMHADGNNLNMHDGMEAVGRSFDHAVAAFIDDVEQRGLRDKIMLVTTGEMGRTPRINSRGGRDHWSKLAPLMLYGGGLEGGRVIGQSTRDGGEPASSPLTPQHLISTILHTVFDVPRLRLVSGIPDPVKRLSEHAPIPVG